MLVLRKTVFTNFIFAFFHAVVVCLCQTKYENMAIAHTVWGANLIFAHFQALLNEMCFKMNAYAVCICGFKLQSTKVYISFADGMKGHPWWRRERKEQEVRSQLKKKTYFA